MKPSKIGLLFAFQGSLSLVIPLDLGGGDVVWGLTVFVDSWFLLEQKMEIMAEGPFAQLWLVCQLWSYSEWKDLTVIHDDNTIHLDYSKIAVQNAIGHFLLGFMDKQTEKKHGTLFVCMTTAARQVQRWKNVQNPTMEEWMVKLMELYEMAKLITLIKEKTSSSVVSTWRPFLDFLFKSKIKETLILRFDDQNCL